MWLSESMEVHAKHEKTSLVHLELEKFNCTCGTGLRRCLVGLVLGQLVSEDLWYLVIPWGKKENLNKG